MGVEISCNCVRKHQRHICMLRHKGLTGSIKDLTGFPNVACLNCGESADSEDNVCIPTPLFI